VVIRADRVARARAPAALDGAVAGGSRLVPRHRGGRVAGQLAMRREIAGGAVVEWRLLAQKGLGRLLHRGGTRAGGAHRRVRIGRASRERAAAEWMRRGAVAVTFLDVSGAASTAAINGWRRCRRDRDRWRCSPGPAPAARLHCTGPTRSGCSLTCLGPPRATCMIRLPQSAPDLEA
jgi:hypothetical protein